MSKNQINTLLIENSFILNQGLTQALNACEKKMRVISVNSLTDAEKYLQEIEIGIVILSPSIAYFNNKEFLMLRKTYKDIRWIGFVYQLYDEQLLSLFNTTINIGDSSDKINETIMMLLESDENYSYSLEKLLSEREIEVLKLLALGFSNKEIADKLYISINTAITHRKNITQKTGIKTISGLTIYAVVNKHITLGNSI